MDEPTVNLSELPWLWGDNLHDDTAALQAILDGKPVIDARTTEVLHPPLYGGRVVVNPREIGADNG